MLAGVAFFSDTQLNTSQSKAKPTVYFVRRRSRSLPANYHTAHNVYFMTLVVLIVFAVPLFSMRYVIFTAIAFVDAIKPLYEKSMVDSFVTVLLSWFLESNYATIRSSLSQTYLH